MYAPLWMISARRTRGLLLKDRRFECNSHSSWNRDLVKMTSLGCKFGLQVSLDAVETAHTSRSIECLPLLP